MFEDNLSRQESVSNIETIDTGIPVDVANKTVIKVQEEIEKAGGKIPYSKFMEVSLYGEDGYYSAGKVKISEEDRHFITSSEVSEMFGATIGSGCMKIWQAMGKPPSFKIIEMGAGKGGLADSFLKWVKEIDPAFQKAVKYHIVEYAPELISQQRARILPLAQVAWIRGSAYEVPLHEVEGVFISNELPDAFPIERIKKVNGELKQCFVTIKNGQWVEVWDSPSPQVLSYLDRYQVKIQEGQEEPFNLNAERFQHNLDKALKRGAIITIDYGGYGEVGKLNKPSIRCFGSEPETDRKWQAAYQKPGQVDITADVNFKVLEEAAHEDGLEVVSSGNQATLMRLFGLYKLHQDIYEEFGQEKRWNRVIDLEKKLKDALELVGFGSFYSHILTKNLAELGDLLSEPKIKIRGSDPCTVQEYMQRFNMDEQRVLQDLWVGMLRMDPELYFEIGNFGKVQIIDTKQNKKEEVELTRGKSLRSYPSNLKNLIIYDESGKLIYDLTDPVTYRKFIDKHGYRFER